MKTLQEIEQYVIKKLLELEVPINFSITEWLGHDMKNKTNKDKAIKNKEVYEDIITRIDEMLEDLAELKKDREK